ncbi:hypothetical protein [Polaribacter sp. Asnod6-C07]|uniref:hypothetical protein n=1 Tax=Polaribacter sp. Asnod6-C07 TaxID=3160582 RepID=UPI00386B198B
MTLTLFVFLVIALRVFYALKKGNKTKKDVEQYNYDKKTTMLFWEDNYLTVELVPKENMEFILADNKRIKKHGEEHFSGKGFTEITEIEEIPFKTEKMRISIEKITKLFESIGLSKYEKLLYCGGGKPTEIENPKTIAYGEFESAIFLEPSNGELKHIWIDSNNWENLPTTKIENGLKAIGKEFDLILVDWISNKVIDLKNEIEIEKYIKTE